MRNCYYRRPYIEYFLSLYFIFEISEASDIIDFNDNHSMTDIEAVVEKVSISQILIQLVDFSSAVLILAGVVTKMRRFYIIT